MTSFELGREYVSASIVSSRNTSDPTEGDTYLNSSTHSRWTQKVHLHLYTLAASSLRFVIFLSSSLAPVAPQLFNAISTRMFPLFFGATVTPAQTFPVSSI